MNIQLYNTADGSKTTFTPQRPNEVTVYVCGPTVYNLVHIGNGRPAVVFDVLVRLLELDYEVVRYARNVTDIDDKINAAALANGEPIQALADRFTEAYESDMRGLGVRTPTITPRATHHIPEIIEFIQALIATEHAYAAEGHVLFHVPSDPAYGQLSRRTLEDMLDGARIDVAPYKRDPKDFVLWKPSTAELPGWDSPWGRGRPGWHIECSAMIQKHLGESIDIHGGGSDLIFPHHENELAQSRCVHGGNAVRYWLHNAMLNLGGEKMSKSLGNIVTIRDLLEQYSGETLRYALLSGHYRSTLAWSNDLLEQAQASLDRLYGALRETPTLNARTSESYALQSAAQYPAEVLETLCDDLNTPRALAALHAIASNIHRTDDADEKELLGEQLLAGGWLLGIMTCEVDEYFQRGTTLGAAQIEALIEARNVARKDKDFARADAIRDELLGKGIELEDTRDGTRWQVIQ